MTDVTMKPRSNTGSVANESLSENMIRQNQLQRYQKLKRREKQLRREALARQQRIKEKVPVYITHSDGQSRSYEQEEMSYEELGASAEGEVDSPKDLLLDISSKLSILHKGESIDAEEVAAKIDTLEEFVATEENRKIREEASFKTASETATGISNNTVAPHPTNDYYKEQSSGGVNLSQAERDALVIEAQEGETVEKRRAAMRKLSGTTEGKYETPYAGEIANLKRIYTDRNKFVVRAQDPELSPEAHRAAMAMMSGTLAGKYETIRAGEKQFQIDDARIQERLAQGPIESTDDYHIRVDSILKIPKSDQPDMSKEAFGREKDVVDRVYGDDKWTSAGGTRKTYQETMGIEPDNIKDEYYLTSQSGRGFTLVFDNSGKWEIRSWYGGYRSSGQSVGESFDALKKEFDRLDVPYDKSAKNVLDPDAAETVFLDPDRYMVDEQKPANLKSKLMGTYYDIDDITDWQEFRDEQEAVKVPQVVSPPKVQKYDIIIDNDMKETLKSGKSVDFSAGDMFPNSPELQEATQDGRVAYDPSTKTYQIYDKPFEHEHNEYKASDYSEISKAAGEKGVKIAEATAFVEEAVKYSGAGRPVASAVEQSSVRVVGGMAAIATMAIPAADTAAKIVSEQGPGAGILTAGLATGTGLYEMGKGIYEKPAESVLDLAVGAAVFGGAGAIGKAVYTKSPVKIGVGSAEFPNYKFKSIEYVRSKGVLDTSKPIITLGKGEGRIVSAGSPKLTLTELVTNPKGEPYSPLTPLEAAIVKKSAGPEAGKINLALDVRKDTQYSGLTLEDFHPQAVKVLKNLNARNAEDVADVVVKSLKEQEGEVYGSIVQYGIGKEKGTPGLSRTPRDFDVSVNDPTKFDVTVAARINKATGERFAIVDESGGVKTKHGEKLFDTHSKTDNPFDEFQRVTESEYLTYGIRSSGLAKTKEGIEVATLSEQASKKIHGGLKVFGEDVEYNTGGFKKPVSGKVMPAHEGRVKDWGDLYFAERVAISEMYLSASPKTRFRAARAESNLEKWVDELGPDAAAKIRETYKTALEDEGVKIPVRFSNPTKSKLPATDRVVSAGGVGGLFSPPRGGEPFGYYDRKPMPEGKIDISVSKVVSERDEFPEMFSIITPNKITKSEFVAKATKKTSSPSSIPKMKTTKSTMPSLKISGGRRSTRSSIQKSSIPSSKFKIPSRITNPSITSWKCDPYDPPRPPRSSEPSITSDPSNPYEPSNPPRPYDYSNPSKPSNPYRPSEPSNPYKPLATSPPWISTDISDPYIPKTPISKKTTSQSKRRRKREGFNLFNMENVEIPIIRGEEALGGKYNPLERPANKRMFAQLGSNVFEVSKKTGRKIKKKSGKRKKDKDFSFSF